MLLNLLGRRGMEGYCRIKWGGESHCCDVESIRRDCCGLTAVFLMGWVGRQNSGPFLPSFSLAVRLLLLVRVSAAMYSNIQDCDEGQSRSS
jgi:hypothetical protein